MKIENQNNSILTQKPLDYLVIGHLTADLTEDGTQLGGTVAFSGMTGQALGLETGIITSCADDLDTELLNNIQLFKITSKQTTTFKNISDGVHRDQYLYHIADPITKDMLPAFRLPPAIIHLGPVANEVDPAILDAFPDSLKCLTPQGWFRRRNQDNKVELHPWQNWEKILSKVEAAVISIDDVQKDEEIISKMAAATPVFVVTENYLGARVYWNNDARFINAPEVKYLDDTGAGDIFAAAFFYRYYMTREPWEAGRFAVLLASWSVTRSRLESIPKSDEIKKAKQELMAN
jgi:sugar/nucleoside kinase (ribokinase family)